MKLQSNLLKNGTILLFWLLLWQGFSLLIHNKIFLVGPLDTLAALGMQISSVDFWGSIIFSFSRICLGFFLAFGGGLLTGSLAYRYPLFQDFLSPAVQLMKSVPVASFVILALIWTGSENLSVFISFIVVFPMIHVSTSAGLSSTDRKLLEMSSVFCVPAYRKILFLYRPALFPYLMSTCRTALAMGFKSGIAAEVIGVPAGSIGEGLYLAKIYLSTADLFAWTLVIIAVSSLFEKLVLLFLNVCAGKGGSK